MSAHAGNDRNQDPETVARLTALRAADDEAVASLHDLLLRAARFEVSRRRASIPLVAADEVEDLAAQAADGALVAVLDNLGEFRGTSRFTTWACKFALLEAGALVHRLAWKDREVVETDCSSAFCQTTEQLDPARENQELVGAIRDCLADDLTPHQQRALAALVIDEVPIDVLAERWHTTRGALYQAVHDGRRRIRTRLAERGLTADPIPVSRLGAT